MKKTLSATICFAIIGWAGIALTAPIDFKIDAEKSSVSLDTTSWGATTLSVYLAEGLKDVEFTLKDDETSAWFNFLTFEASGTGLGQFDTKATLAFYSPIVDPVSSAGQGVWGAISFFGVVQYAAGGLYWDNNAIDFQDVLGNNIFVTLEQGLTFTDGSPVHLQAQITNKGGGMATIPEPTTLLLFGNGLIGLAGIVRKKVSSAA